MNERQTAGRSAADEGFTLIEVIVALLVFAILSTGVVAGSSTIIRMTVDNRARITAANLASQDLDLVRAIADPFSIESIDAPGQTIGVDGTTYHLTRSVSWLSTAGADVSCNSSTNLFLLRVNDEVDWDGRLDTTATVRNDTILAPVDGTTASDLGAIAISVTTASGTPVKGVVVTVTPVMGAPLKAQPRNTTAGGCTYANAVTPGSYQVKISKPGYISDTQQPTATKNVTVSAGSTQSVGFVYEQAATFFTEYTTGPVRYSGSTRLPTNLPTSFISGSTYTTAAPASSVQLFPSGSGYTAVAGPLNSTTDNCASVDPQAWGDGVTVKPGVRGSAVAAPGGTATLTIPLGVVQVRATPGARLTATQAPSSLGTPGCGISGTVLTYPGFASGGQDALQLPYGTWRILANGVPVSFFNLTVKTNTLSGGVAFDGSVTLDPRAAR